MSPLVIVCLVLLVLLFVGDLLLRGIAPAVASEWSWKARPVLHVALAGILITLLIVFKTFGI